MNFYTFNFKMIKPEQHYSEWLVGLLVTILVLIILLNYFVDPYQIFSANKSALYVGKPALHSNIRLHKAHQVNLQKPDTIILGTSKAIQGIPLNHPAFSGSNLYNLSAPLASMREIYKLLRHAQANNRLNKIVFAVDFLSFNALARTDGQAAGFSEERLRESPKDNILYPNDYLSALLSFDAVSASIMSLFVKQSPEHRVINGMGGRESEEILSRLADGGHRTNTVFIESFFTNAVYLSAPHRRFEFSNSDDNSFTWFERFLTQVYQNDIDTTLLIGPSHARLWELLNLAGIWPKFEQWKRKLVSINESVAAQYGRQPIALWDFTSVNSITSEAFPKAGDSSTRMRYYYESVHFNQITGHLVLDTVFGLDRPDSTPEDFGVLLTSSTLEETLVRNRKKQALFRKLFPDYVNELQQIIPTH